jgi:hypothetical protein
MHRLLRKPLLWMIVAELAVVGALIVVVWQVMTGPPTRDGSLPPAAPISVAASEPPSPSPLEGLASPPPAGALQLPGLNLNTEFWRQRLIGLNRDEAQFEQLQWRFVHSAMDVVHRYLDAVVLPAIVHVERGGG